MEILEFALRYKEEEIIHSDKKIIAACFKQLLFLFINK